MSQAGSNSNGGASGGSLVNFQAQKSTTSNNVTGDGTAVNVIYDQVNWNVGGGYNSGTGIFTAPRAGVYCFTGTICLTNVTAGHNKFLGQINNTSGITYNSYEINPANVAEVNTNLIMQFATNVKLAVGGTAQFNIAVSGGAKVVGLGGSATFALNVFSGFLVG